MDVSLFLAQLFALYFLAAGISMLAKQDAAQKMVDELANHPYQLYFAGFFVFIMGSLLLLFHNVWDDSWRTVITVISWLIFLKGLAYLWLPQKALAKWIRAFNNKSWYSVGALVSIILGLYLGWIGFLA